jgi:hypothetical protein
MLMNNVLGSIWKEGFVAKSKVLPQHFSGGTEKLTINLNEDCRSPSQYVNSASPECETASLLTVS